MKKIMMFVIAALLTIGLTIGPANAFVDSDADADAKAESMVDNRDYSKSNGVRQLPGGVYQPPMANPQYHNAPHTRTWNILPFVELAKIRRIWTRQQLEVVLDWAEGDEGEVTSIPYNAVPAETKKSDRSPLDTIAIVFSTVVPEGYHDTGMVQAKGEADTNGVKMAAQSMLNAMNMAGDYIMITVEDAEIQQYTKAAAFFLGGGMSAIGGDGPSGATGGGGASGIGFGKITSGKALAPHMTAYVIEENDNCFEVLDSGKVRCATEEELVAYQNALGSKEGAASLDEDGRGPEPTVKDAKSGNGKTMKRFYLETDQ